MQITDVTSHLISVPWYDDPWFPQKLFSSALIRIETDTEIEGLGETTLGYFAAESVPALVEYFRSVLVGENPLDTQLLANSMYTTAVWWSRSGAGRSVIGGIELALWDIKGKALGVPVYQLLGGKTRDRIPVYASGGPSIWPPSENVERIDHYASLGYQCAKLSTHFYELPPRSRSGLGPLKEVDIAFPQLIDEIASNFAGLREAFGADFDFAVDGHQGGLPNPILVSEAVEIAEALAPFRLRFFEEPLAYGNVDGYAELRRRSRIPIAGGESLSGLDQFHALIVGGGLHIVQPDIGFIGGLSEALRVVHHAEAYDLATAIHTGASVGPGLAASWHLAAASGSVEWLETVVASRSAQLDFLGPEFAVEDGTVGLPSESGFGVRFSTDLLDRYAYVPKTGQRT